MTLTAEQTPPARAPRKSRLRAVPVSRSNRSTLSNRGTILQGVDGRSQEGRRIRDLVVSFSEETFGMSFDALGEGDAALVKHAAVATYRAEVTQSAIARGEAVNSEDYVREANALTRAMAALHKRRKPRSSTPSIHDIAARHRNGGAGA
jgi:hypothetical protein